MSTVISYYLISSGTIVMPNALKINNKYKFSDDSEVNNISNSQTTFFFCLAIRQFQANFKEKGKVDFCGKISLIVAETQL